MQRTVVQLIDDLDGSTADETLSFALDGTVFEIDLTTANAKGLRATLAPYVEAGRRMRNSRDLSAHLPGRSSASGRGAPGHSARPASERLGVEPAVVRAWAIEQGMDISERGRVSAEIYAAYKAAH